MKIGILTFWWSNDNYGQLLQCYALQKYLDDMGHDAFLIRYKRNDILPNPLFCKIIKAFNPIELFRHIKFMINKKRTLNCLSRDFNGFRQKYLKLSEIEYDSYEQMKSNPPNADIYIVGSDQVWNFSNFSVKRYLFPIHAYFLDFGSEKTLRLSYAASWGVDDITSKLRNVITPLLSRFDYVSVREEKGIDLCKKCGFDKVEWVCDPTLLLDADTYRKIYKENKIRKQENKYIFLYMLSAENELDVSKVWDFAKTNELAVVYVKGNSKFDGYESFEATIPEWLYLLDNAEYVITNSYHCAVFSSIFQKHFGVSPVIGKDSGMNTRLDSLFKMLNIDERFIYKNDFSVLFKDYKPISVQSPKGFLQVIGENR